MATELKNMDIANKKVLKDNAQLHTQMDKLQRRVIELEDRSRCDNLIFHGITQQGNENHQEIKNHIQLFLKEKLKVNSQIQGRIHSLPKGNNKFPPIIVQFLEDKSRSQVLKQAKHLKGTSFFINHDFSTETRNTRKKLIHYMWEARKEGHNAFHVYNKLCVNDKLFFVEDFPDCPETSNNHGNYRTEGQLDTVVNEEEPELELSNVIIRTT